MERRYQVFVSSTYEDLKDERAEVIQALLELDCFPAGMELFPAANDEQWEWIKRVIDESDYYILISAGRYGRIHPTLGLSYTELEFNYAVSTGKKVLSFLHGDIDTLPGTKLERAEDGRKNITRFRAACEQRLCKYWNSPSDLGSKVSRGITQLIHRNPGVGWIRGDRIDHDIFARVEQLEKENLELKIGKTASSKVPDSYLAFGEDEIAIDFLVATSAQKINSLGKLYWVKGGNHWQRTTTSWDNLFDAIADTLIADPFENEIVTSLNNFCKANVDYTSLRNGIRKHLGEDVDLPDSEDEKISAVEEVVEFDDDDNDNDNDNEDTPKRLFKVDYASVSSECLATIRRQLYALNLISFSKTEFRTTWLLTAIGQEKIRTLAISKDVQE